MANRPESQDSVYWATFAIAIKTSWSLHFLKASLGSLANNKNLANK